MGHLKLVEYSPCEEEELSGPMDDSETTLIAGEARHCPCCPETIASDLVVSPIAESCRCPVGHRFRVVARRSVVARFELDIEPVDL